MNKRCPIVAYPIWEDGNVVAIFSQINSYPISRKFLESCILTGMQINNYDISYNYYGGISQELDLLLDRFPNVKEFWINISIERNGPETPYIVDWEWHPGMDESIPIYSIPKDLKSYLKSTEALMEIASITITMEPEGMIPCNLYE